MPLIKPKFVPGIIKDDSKLAAEGGWTDSDKIRFVADKPQVIGGWEGVSAELDVAWPFDEGVFDSGVFYAGATVTSAMYTGQVRSAHAWVDNDGANYLAWGTGAGLFVLHNGTIYDITPAGFTPETSEETLPYGAGAYGVGVYGRGIRTIWSLGNFGQNLLASPRGGGLYEWSLNTAVKALVVAGAPTQIDFMFVSPERIVVLLGTQAFGGTYSPMLVRWCDQGVNTQWTPADNNLAGEFPLAHGSTLVSGLAARGLNALWSDTCLYTMQFTGSVNNVFIIRQAGYGCGLIGPHARTASDSGIYWMSRNNFHAFNGQSVSTLPSPVREDVFNNIAASDAEKSHVAWNSGYSEPWFFYPDERDGTGECSRYAMMNSQGHWAVGSFDRTAWVKADVFPYPIAFSANDRRLYYQEIPDAGADDEPLEAFIESGFIDVGDGDTLYTITRIVPDFNNQGPNIDVSLKTKLWPNQSETTRGPYLATPTTEKIDIRVKAREMAVRLESAGVAGASFWELGAIGFKSQQSGEKR